MLPLSTHIFLGLQLDSSKIFWKALVLVIPFLSFKGITHVHLLKISVTHNKKRIPLLNLLINCVSGRSAPQRLSIEDECTFLFLKFLIIRLCNYFVWNILIFNITTRRFCIKKCIKNWSKAPLIFIIFWIFSNLHKQCHVENILYLVRFDKYISNLLFL